MNSLTVQDIKNIFAGGARNLEINKALIDNLNVFPVPDGDTGTNMHLTMVSTLKELDAVESEAQGDVCRAVAKGALKGARGNSGVILSQIFKGMTEVLAEARVVNTKAFAEALKHGSNVAYDVVTNPKEGTILTVIRLMSESAVKIAPKKTNFLEFFQLILKKGDQILDDTPNMLPVLKKAGVVDAGGKGLLTIITGMYNVLASIEMLPPEETEGSEATAEQSRFQPDIHNLDNIEFGYCTEFFVINMKTSTTVSDIDKLRDRLTKIGDSVIVVGDLALVKVHVHSNNPDKVLGYALQLGELERLKIDNMREQSRQFKKEVEKQKRKPAGLVAICAGEGLKNIFTELNADAVLEGGQTMNPSVSDIVNAVNSVRAETVYILPNNSNIILAAEQAKELVDSELVVIATKSIPQGVAAAVNMNPEASPEENARAMQKAAEAIRSGQVTHAVRDTEMDGFELKNGEVIGIYDKIVAKGTDIDAVTEDVIVKMTDDSTSAITLYYGEGIKESAAKKLSSKLQKKFPYHDIMLYHGGQSHYFYFIAVE